MSGGPGIFLNRMAVIVRNLLEDARGGLQVLDPLGKYFMHLVSDVPRATRAAEANHPRSKDPRREDNTRSGCRVVPITSPIRGFRCETPRRHSFYLRAPSDSSSLAACTTHRGRSSGFETIRPFATGRRRRPRACSTFSTVAKPGFPSRESALYRLSRPSPDFAATAVIPLGTGHVSERSRDHARIAVLERRFEISHDIALVFQIVRRVPWAGPRPCDSRFRSRSIHELPPFTNSRASSRALSTSCRWVLLSPPSSSTAKSPSIRRKYTR